MPSTSSGKFQPFQVQTSGDAGYWYTALVLFIVAGLVGWWCDLLTAALLLAIAAYTVDRFHYGQRVTRQIIEDAHRGQTEWEALRELPPSSLPQMAKGHEAGPLMRAAAAMVSSIEHAGRVSTGLIVDAVMHRHTKQIAVMDQAAENAPRLGLAGTAAGLLVLYSGIEAGEDVEALTSSVFAALGGMQLAVSTTLAGVLAEKLLANQRAIAERAAGELQTQMLAQLSMLNGR